MRNHLAGKITLGGILTALALLFLYAGALLPTGTAALAAVAGLFPAVCFLFTGWGGGILTYAAAALLGFALLPNRMCLYLFILFFGYYGLVKVAAETVRNRVLSWAIRFAVFNAALLAVFLLLPALVGLPFPDTMDRTVVTVLTWLILNAVFLLYDIGLSRLLDYFRKRIVPLLNKKVFK